MIFEVIRSLNDNKLLHFLIIEIIFESYLKLQFIHESLEISSINSIEFFKNKQI